MRVPVALPALQAYAASGSHRIGLRTLEILNLYARGLCTRDVAAMLEIAPGTVRVYVSRLRRRARRSAAARRTAA